MCSLIEGCEFTFGKHHGKNRVRLPLQPEKFKIANYLIPIEPNKVYVIKNTPKDTKDLLTKYFHRFLLLKKTGLLVIYSIC